MRIERRGKPPYQIHSGDQTFIKSHYGTANTYREAIYRIFDLSNAGLDVRGGPWTLEAPYIKDSAGRVVFSVDCDRDRRLLRKLDQEGLSRLQTKWAPITGLALALLSQQSHKKNYGSKA